jgi:hypothetical protein
MRRAQTSAPASRAVRVTGAPVAVAPTSERPRIRRVEPLRVQALPEFKGKVPERTFTLAPMKLLEPNRGWMHLSVAHVYPDEWDGLARLYGSKTHDSFVDVYLQAVAGRTYVIEVIAHPDQPGDTETFHISHPGGIHQARLSWEDPRTVIAFSASSSGTHRFIIRHEGTKRWYFQALTVTLLQ